MADEQTIRLSMIAPDIATLTIDAPDKNANILSQSVLDELQAHLDALQPRDDLAGLIIRSAKPGMFIAGADLREFAASLDIPPEQTVEMCTRGRSLFQRLSNCPFVTVAAIDGICVGGGTEMSLWCDRRILTDNRRCQIGLPEVKLGLFPGWGGTARLPRIIGLSGAVEMIAGGDSIDGAAAAAMGLADDLVRSEALDQAAVGMIRAEQESKQYLEDRKTWSGPIDISETELAFLGATASGYIQQQTKGHYPAPLAALEVMLGAAAEEIDVACEMEAEGMSGLFGTPVNAALLNVFFLTDRNKKDPGIDRADVRPRSIGSVGVIGAGIMGSGIGAANVRRKVPITITDSNPDVLAGGVQSILKEVSYNKKTGGPDVERAIEFAPLVGASTSQSELACCDLVIEAIVENADVKSKLFAQLEPLLPAETILASNTSTIPIGTLAEGMKHPRRFCGIHFFNPVRKMPLVEVIRGPQTSDETIATAVAYAKQIGKSPIVVNDGPGFLVNRLLLPYMNEAVEMVLDGVPLGQIERAAKTFGMPMGPFTLFDVVGLDTALYAGGVMHRAFPERTVASPLLAMMVKKGRLGQKSGAGFFKYGGKRPERGEPDPLFDEVLEPMLREGQKLSPDQITNRLFLPMLLEATRVLDEGIVRDPRDVDLGLIFGIGFPPFKGGLLHWADMLGAAAVARSLAPLADVGSRFEVTPMLAEMAAAGGTFYA